MNSKKVICQFEQKIDEKDKYDHPLFNVQFQTAVYSLIGAALGDGIGAPIENKKPYDIANGFKKEFYSKSLSPEGLIHTDDTQMTISIIESYICTGKFDNCYIKQLWIELARQDYFTLFKQPLQHYQKGGFRGTGSNFRNTIDELIKYGVDYDATKNTSGNGVAMRSTPLAIYVFKFKKNERLQKLKEEVLKNTFLTSKSPLTATSSFAYAYLLMNWLDKDSKYSLKSPYDQFQDLASKVRTFEEQIKNMKEFIINEKELYAMSKMFIALTKNVQTFKKIDDVYDLILEVANKTSKGNLVSVNDGYALTSVTSAIVTAIFQKDEPFLNALRTVMIKGGDTDTVGCMCGALLGAHIACKNEKIPYFFRQQLFDYEYLFKYFYEFITFVETGKTNSNLAGDFIIHENKVNFNIIRCPPSERSEYYCSKKNNRRMEKDLAEEIFIFIKSNSQLEPDTMYNQFFNKNIGKYIYIPDKERFFMFKYMWIGISKKSSFEEAYQIYEKNLKEKDFNENDSYFSKIKNYIVSKKI